MKRKIAVALILLFAFILNANLFERMFSTSKDYSISQGEVTIYALRAVKNKYLNKSKLQAADLLVEGLNAIHDQLPETLIKYDRNRNQVTVQIYNHTYTANVGRMRDLYDIAYVLKQVYGFIEKNYVPDASLEITDVEYIAVNGILKKLDPHSYIFTPKEFEEFTSSTEGNFGGLGIVISVNDDGEIVVVSPMDGTPAMEAGVEANDVIVQIDDESAINMTLNKAVERMRGKPGTSVTIRIRREGVPDLLKFTITRAEIKIESVVSAMPEPGIGYIKLSGFMENTYPSMLSALEDLKKKGMKSLVLDMRNNSGGLLSQAIKISDIFLERGVIVSTVGDDEDDVSEAEKQNTDILDIPVTVMINEGTASAAEIVTAALKKNGRASVLGRKSFGKGSVQNLFRIPGGGGMKLTIAQYLTPGGVSIQSVGITPEIEIRPAFIHNEKISLFDMGENIVTENKLKEHIVSSYIPQKPEKPDIIVRYFKEYKDTDQIVKERRKEKIGAFKSDEEIEIAIKIMKEMISNGIKPNDAAVRIKESEWSGIVSKLTESGIPWKSSMSLRQPDLDSLKVSLLSSQKIIGGSSYQFKFKAEIEGEIENLIGVLETDIPFLRRLEIPFGTFSGSIERTVNIKLPESVPWRKENAQLKLYTGTPDKVIKIKDFVIETMPVDSPDIKLSFLSVDSGGSVDGMIQPGEEVKLLINFTNIGKGAVLDGRAMLINVDNSKEIFINSGTLSFTLAPGETKSAEFKFKLSNFEAKETLATKLAVSLYDYKTKYNSGFSVPIYRSGAGCVFESREAGIVLEKGVEIFSAADLKNVYGIIKERSVLKSTGKCGEAYLSEDGFWIRSENVKTSEEKPSKLQMDIKYSIKMPGIFFDRSPSLSENGKFNIAFEINPAETRDVFVFINDKKYFYKRLSETGSVNKISVPVTLEKKINSISIVAKGYDREKTAFARKHVVFPKGSDNEEE
ncbi:MAG: S41 family peptidase [bacterium]|nr:S41 family peptidase [bacterium]